MNTQNILIFILKKMKYSDYNNSLEDYLKFLSRFKAVETIDSVYNAELKQLEILKRIKSSSMFLTDPPRPKPDHIWKEIWCVSEGQLILKSLVEGRHEHSYVVKEKFIFEDEK